MAEIERNCERGLTVAHYIVKQEGIWAAAPTVKSVTAKVCCPAITFKLDYIPWGQRQPFLAISIATKSNAKQQKNNIIKQDRWNTFQSLLVSIACWVDLIDSRCASTRLNKMFYQLVCHWRFTAKSEDEFQHSWSRLVSDSQELHHWFHSIIVSFSTTFSLAIHSVQWP